MTSRKSDTGRLVYFLVFTYTKIYLVEANSVEDAPLQAARKLGVAGRVWIWRDWTARLATPEEVEVRLKQDTTQGQATREQAVRRQRERLHFHA